MSLSDEEVYWKVRHEALLNEVEKFHDSLRNATLYEKISRFLVARRLGLIIDHDHEMGISVQERETMSDDVYEEDADMLRMNLSYWQKKAEKLQKKLDKAEDDAAQMKTERSGHKARAEHLSKRLHEVAEERDKWKASANRHSDDRDKEIKMLSNKLMFMSMECESNRVKAEDWEGTAKNFSTEMAYWKNRHAELRSDVERYKGKRGFPFRVARTILQLDDLRASHIGLLPKS